MTYEDCYELGHILKAKGLKGELVLYLDVDDPEEYEDMDSFFVEINRKLVPYFIESLKIQGKRVTVSLNSIDDIEKAKPLVGARLFLPVESLPDLEEGEFYLHELIGFQVVDQQLGKLGKITSIYDSGPQDLIAMDYQGKEILIPVVDHILIQVHRDQQEVEVNLPEGLVDIYLEE